MAVLIVEGAIMPQFSVVIPLYNKAAHIAATLQTVLNQTFRNFEVVVIDDGSTDGSGEIAEQFASERVRVVRQQNAGVSAARNTGIAASIGRYIAFLDADDEWFPNHLAELVGLIDKFPGLGLYSAAHETVEGGRVYHRCQPRVYGKRAIIADFLAEYARSFSLVNSSTACLPRSIFKEIGEFPLGIRTGEDVVVWMKAALAQGMAYSTEVGTRVNRDAVNRSNQVRDEGVPYYIVWLDEAYHERRVPGSAQNVLQTAVLTNIAGARLSGGGRVPPEYKSLRIAQQRHMKAKMLIASHFPIFLLKMIKNVRWGRK